MIAHARVLERVLLKTSVLPVSFGQICRDPEALGQHLADHAQLLCDRLDRLRGKAEYSVRITAPREAVLTDVGRTHPQLARRIAAIGSEGAAAHFERIEIGRRVAEIVAARRDKAQSSLLGALAPHADAHVLRAPEDDMELLRAAFLLDLTAEERFEEVASALAAGSSLAGGADLEVRMLGPGPASSFVDLSVETGLSGDACHGHS
jgi:hypothetical protein